MAHKQIYYSDKYFDEHYEYRHVMLPRELSKHQTPETLRRRPDRAAACIYDGLVSVAVRPTNDTCASSHFPAAMRFWTYTRCSSGVGGRFRLWRWLLQYQQAATMFSSVSRPPSERACRCSAVQRSAFEVRLVLQFR